MWTTENRCRRNRDKLRYVSEVADTELIGLTSDERTVPSHDDWRKA